MSEQVHGVGVRRRPSRVGPDSEEESGAQHQEPGARDSSSGPGASTGGFPELVGQQGIRDTLQGTGMGTFAPLVASHMLLTQAGLDPALLGGNTQMQQNMRSGDSAGGSWSGALEGSVGPVPGFARDRIETATGGSMGPMAGVPGSVPGVVRHAIDEANSGGTKNPRQGSDPRDQKPRDDRDLGQVFGAMSGLQDEQFDTLLMNAGKEFMRGLDESETHELMGEMGQLPEEEQQDQPAPQPRQQSEPG